ncbi:hypothetical protein PTKIN_Ptkin14bG0124000 [Pterospermum kingtungense]
MSRWSKPPYGAVKYNVDGSSLGRSEPAGIKGIMRDHQENVLIRFSKSVGVEDSNIAELLTIREAFVLFFSSSWAQTRTIIVKSDSMVALVHILREANQVADHLGKEEVNRLVDFVAFYPGR